MATPLASHGLPRWHRIPPDASFRFPSGTEDVDVPLAAIQADGWSIGGSDVVGDLFGAIGLWRGCMAVDLFGDYALEEGRDPPPPSLA